MHFELHCILNVVAVVVFVVVFKNLIAVIYIREMTLESGSGLFSVVFQEKVLLEFLEHIEIFRRMSEVTREFYPLCLYFMLIEEKLK